MADHSRAHGQSVTDGREPFDRRLAFQLTGLAALLLVLYMVFGFVVPQTSGRLG